MRKERCWIKSNKDYRVIYKYGKKYHGRYIIVFIKENDCGYNRFGIVTSKKIGNAVVRNRAKRQLRAILFNNKEKMATGFDMVIVARFSIKGAISNSIEKDFLNLIRKARLR